MSPSVELAEPSEATDELVPAEPGGVQAIAETGPDSVKEGAGQESPEPPPTAAHARLGPEGVLRLRARHAEILARISERIADPVRREELKAQAERLNPDSWVTADEVTAGLDQYEMIFEVLRAAIGHRRGRRRRRGGPTSV